MEKRTTKYRQRINTRGRIVLGLVLLLGLIGVGTVAYLYDTRPADKTNTEMLAVTIADGTTANEIIQQLKDQGLVKNDVAFKYYLKRNGLSSKLRAGEYLLSPSMSMEEIVDALLNGIGVVERITVPEGYTLRDIAALFAENEIMTEEQFWEQVQSDGYSHYEFLQAAPDNEHRLEGFLFPDTYMFAKGSQPEIIIDAMLKRFQEVYESMPENISGLDDYQTLILASMIEAEAKLDDERATIASVYLNRLEINMPMQCDATILYDMPERKTQLRYSDYEYQSEYNTYLFNGFPPTPICNPGRQSLLAACQPAETEYLYYLWNKIDNDGHVFARTYNGHLQNRETYGY